MALVFLLYTVSEVVHYMSVLPGLVIPLYAPSVPHNNVIVCQATLNLF